jgi:hypothetical protein
LKLVGFLDLLFSKLDLASSVSFLPSRVIPPGFSASQLPNTTSSSQIRPPHAGAWISRTCVWISPSDTSAPRACQCSPNSAHQPLLLFSGLFVALLLYFLFIVVLCFVGYYLLAFYWFVSLVKTFVIELVLVPLFTTILLMDFSSVFITSTSFR